MKKAETAMDDDLRPEYDLGSLRVRKVGPKRKNFRGQMETEATTLKAHGIDLQISTAEDYDMITFSLRMLTGGAFSMQDAVSGFKTSEAVGARCEEHPRYWRELSAPTLDRNPMISG